MGAARRAETAWHSSVSEFARVEWSFGAAAGEPGELTGGQNEC